MQSSSYPYIRLNAHKNVTNGVIIAGNEGRGRAGENTSEEDGKYITNEALQFVCASLLSVSGLIILIMIANGNWKELLFPLVTTIPSAVVSGSSQRGVVPDGAPTTSFRDMTLFSEISDTGASISVGYSIAAFCLISGVAEFAAMGVMIAYKETEFPSRIIYTMRFLEYSVTASIMQVVICGQLGIWDWRALMGIVGLTITCMLCGIIGEMNIEKDQPTAWLAFGTGCVAFFFTWAQVFANFYDTWAKNADAPAFIWAIVFVEFFLFALFGLVQFLQILSGEGNHEQVTRRYIALSIASKMVLAWVVVSQVLANKT